MTRLNPLITSAVRRAATSIRDLAKAQRAISRAQLELNARDVLRVESPQQTHQPDRYYTRPGGENPEQHTLVCPQEGAHLGVVSEKDP